MLCCSSIRVESGRIMMSTFWQSYHWQPKRAICRVSCRSHISILYLPANTTKNMPVHTSSRDAAWTQLTYLMNQHKFERKNRTRCDKTHPTSKNVENERTAERSAVGLSRHTAVPLGGVLWSKLLSSMLEER